MKTCITFSLHELFSLRLILLPTSTPSPPPARLPYRLLSHKLVSVAKSIHQLCFFLIICLITSFLLSLFFVKEVFYIVMLHLSGRPRGRGRNFPAAGPMIFIKMFIHFSFFNYILRENIKNKMADRMVDETRQEFYLKKWLIEADILMFLPNT